MRTRLLKAENAFTATQIGADRQEPLLHKRSTPNSYPKSARHMRLNPQDTKHHEDS